jgi:hypothetical protein
VSSDWARIILAGNCRAFDGCREGIMLHELCYPGLRVLLQGEPVTIRHDDLQEPADEFLRRLSRWDDREYREPYPGEQLRLVPPEHLHGRPYPETYIERIDDE